MPDVQLDRHQYKHYESDQLQPGEEEVVVVEVAGGDEVPGGGGGVDAAVDVAVVPVEEPYAAEEVHGCGAQDAPDAREEPEEAHDDALHGGGCRRVRKLQT